MKPMQPIEPAADRCTILLVDDQPAKLMSYEVILAELGEHLVKANSATEALEVLLKTDVAVVLMDVCMPDLDGFELAAMIRDHPRFQRTAIIFLSAIHLAETDHLRGYEMGAVDYVPVPVVPELLRAKVKVFAELYRKTRQLEQLNRELEQRVAQRTAELEASTARLQESEARRTLALAAGRMGSWDWDLSNGDWMWDEGQCDIFGVDPQTFKPTWDSVARLVDPQDMQRLREMISDFSGGAKAYHTEFRVRRQGGDVRWCLGTAAPGLDERGHVVRVSGITIDITDRKKAEEHQMLLAREVDHRARNALAVVQAIVRLTRATTTRAYVEAVEGRIGALAQAHTLLSESRWQGADIRRLVDEELAPYRSAAAPRVSVAGPPIFLPPDRAQAVALALHELATNAAKYGALSAAAGEVRINWDLEARTLVLRWSELRGPRVSPPTMQGFGTKILNASIQGQIGGGVTWDWQPEGLQCTLSIPCGSRHSANGKGHDAGDDIPRLRPKDLKRVLLVEDQALVGMMMRAMVAESGYVVAGPYHSLDEATAAARTQEFTGAVLDVNLDGGLVYQLCDVLMQQDVPFIFVTGYDHDTVDARFGHVPVLQKPVARETLESLMRATFEREAPPAGAVATREDAAGLRVVGRA
jgi:PAS domain S-box-containing protein